MSVTSLENMRFVKSDDLLGRVKRSLKSFTQIGLVDPNDFYEYAMDVINDLGLGVLLEKQAILEVANNKVRLPEGYKEIYSAQTCSLSNTSSSGISNSIHPQNGYVFYTDSLYERSANKCKCDCDEFKVTVREYIEGVEDIKNYNFEKNLTVIRSKLDTIKNPNYISIDGDYINTGFEKGTIHLKYYSLPIDDETGLPLIPDSNKIQRAIEYYVISKMLLSWYLNDEVPNISQKAAEYNRMYEQAFKDAMTERKTPSFATLVDYAKRQRNKFDTYRSLESYRNY